MRGLFHEPMGVDFSTTFAAGLRARLNGQPPEAMARVTLLVNTTRMARRIEAALAASGATLLPRIGLVSDLAPLLPPGDAPVAGIAPLALRLRLTRLVARLLTSDPSLAPPSAAFDLASSLTLLLAEMQEEGMDADALTRIETGDLSIHWQRTLQFLTIATDWLTEDGTLTPCRSGNCGRVHGIARADPASDRGCARVAAGGCRSAWPRYRYAGRRLGVPDRSRRAGPTGSSAIPACRLADVSD